MKTAKCKQTYIYDHYSFSAIEEELDELADYYRNKNMCVYPGKSPSCIYGTERQKESLKVLWNEVDFENTAHPVNKGVTLDMILSYKQHMHNTKMKLATHNNHLKHAEL